jgi:tRNA-modifying protein YgfZ
MTPDARQHVPWLGEYDALTHRAGLVDLGHRTQIEISGGDRAAFLHNLCTNEVRKLVPGAGREAFLTNVQGKTLAHVFYFVAPDSIVLSTVPGQAELLLAHLDRYLVCEQVTLADRSAEWRELFLSGPESARLLSSLGVEEIPQERLAHAPISLAGRHAWLRRVDIAGPDGLVISAPDADAAAIRHVLVDAGAIICPVDALEAARIERGFPWFGSDISDKNLPQEVGRDALAISFNKGCYLGQETVARIDALGHVNKMLVGVAFDAGQDIQPGLEVLADGQPVGSISSAAYSPRLHSQLALGYVRRGHTERGTQLDSAAGKARVVALPLD